MRSRRAACVWLPSVFSRARTRRLRSLSSRESPSVGISVPIGMPANWPPPSGRVMEMGRLAAVIEGPSSRIIARSMALRSSRTLPGQSCAVSSFAAASVTFSILRLNLRLLDHVIDKIDLVLLMSVNPGFGGQKFIPEAMPKLAQARARIDASGRDIRLEIDGGVKIENAAAIAKAGADTFVAGSAIFGSADYARTIRSMREQIDVGRQR